MTSSSVERFPDKKEAHGPTPWSPTAQFLESRSLDRIIGLMDDPIQLKTINIGQIPSYEIGLVSEAAHALGFRVKGTYGTGTYYNVTPTNKEITVSGGNYGILLSYPEDKDAGKFWDKFFELKGSKGQVLLT